MKHLLSAGDLSRDDATRILDTADELLAVAQRPIKKLPTLRGRTVVNLFFEDSTRTRSSFEIAGKWLSADVIAAQSDVEQRLIDQILKAKVPPTVTEWKAGTDLFKQGFFAQAVHLILDGELSVTVDGAEVARLGPGAS